MNSREITISPNSGWLSSLDGKKLELKYFLQFHWRLFISATG